MAYLGRGKIPAGHPFANKQVSFVPNRTPLSTNSSTKPTIDKAAVPQDKPKVK